MTVYTKAHLNHAFSAACTYSVYAVHIMSTTLCMGMSTCANIGLAAKIHSSLCFFTHIILGYSYIYKTLSVQTVSWTSFENLQGTLTVHKSERAGQHGRTSCHACSSKGSRFGYSHSSDDFKSTDLYKSLTFSAHSASIALVLSPLWSVLILQCS